MKDTAKYTTLDSIIYEYINQANLTDAHYLRLFPIAVRGLKEIHMDITGEPVTRKLGVLPNKTVELPSDCKRWNKIGVINDRGELATLIHNPKFSGYAATDTDRLSANAGSVASPPFSRWDYQNYYSDNNNFVLFGLPPGTTNYGEFKVLEDQGVILLSSDYGYDHVILEYLACPIANGDYMVPDVATECLISWLAWKDIQHTPTSRRSNDGKIRERKREFYNQKNNMRPKAHPVRLQDLNEIFIRGTRLSVKN